MPVLFACLATLSFGAALVTAKFGLRQLDARTGAATSVPTAAAFFVLVAIGWLDLTGLSWSAVGVFALLGLFFPAAVTLLIFVSTDRIGPSLTGAIGGASPLFALLAAFALLAEPVPGRAYGAALGVAAGVAMMSWRHRAFERASLGWLLLLPVAAAALRGFAQVLAKGGLALWPSPLAATVVGYLVSASVLVAASALRRDPSTRRPRTLASTGWMMATGLLNGLGVLWTYMALHGAPVSTVAPIVTTYPLVTLLLGGLVLREEVFSARVLAGAVLTIASVVWLLAGGVPR
jgi:drug/metabolite transporter (DMT)-like permease